MPVGLNTAQLSAIGSETESDRLLGGQTSPRRRTVTGSAWTSGFGAHGSCVNAVIVPRSWRGA
jgi:hypothetical protein